MAGVKRIAAIVLLLAFTGLATGAVEHLHNLQHAHDDAATVNPSAPPGRPHHDESNCDFHRQIHLPAIAAAWVPLLVLLGLFVAFLTCLAPELAPQRAPARPACRG